MIAPEKVIKAQKVLLEKGIDALIILNYVDILYFTGTIQGNLLLIPQKGKAKLFNRRAYERALEEAEEADVISFSSFKEVKTHLVANYKKIGFLFDVTPVNLFQKTLIDLEVKPSQVYDFSNDLKYLKMVKSDEEIQKIRKAGEIVRNAYEDLVQVILSGMTEYEVAIELEYLLRKNGHLGENRFRGYNQIGLSTYVLSGQNVYQPAVHDTPYGGKGIHKAMGVGASNRVIKEGEPFMVDTVGSFEGYHNDNTRTFIFGEPNSEILKSYQSLKEIYLFIASQLKPGVVCEEIYLKTLEKADSLGYRDHFMGIDKTRVAFIGHGIGIQVDEFPVLAKNFKLGLEKGMTIAIEPKLFIESIGGVGLESTFVITENGCECLSPLKDEMIVI